MCISLTLIVAGLTVAPTAAVATGGSVLNQHWELLERPRNGLVATTDIPIERGTIPAGTSAFDPVPTASFHVVAKATAGLGSWTIEVREGTTILAAAGPFTGSWYALKTASFVWPSTGHRTLIVEDSVNLNSLHPGTGAVLDC